MDRYNNIHHQYGGNENAYVSNGFTNHESMNNCPNNRVVGANGYIHHTQNNGYQNYKNPSKSEVINWFKNLMGARELDLVDSTFDQYARHVCLGGNRVEILYKKVYVAQLPKGEVPLEYYQCPKCGKIILNRNFM